MALQQWCIVCGIEHRQSPAIGISEDGDPACILHGGDYELFLQGSSAEPAKVLRKEEVVAPAALAPWGEPMKTCSREGCSNKLRIDNTSGRCTTHGYVPKTKEEKYQTQREKAGKIVRQDAITAPPAKVLGIEDRDKGVTAPAFVSLKVSEAFLDILWDRLSIEQKARCLEGARLDIA